MRCLAALGLAVAVMALAHEQLRHPYWLADLGDPLFSMWRMASVAHQLTTHPTQVFETNIFHGEHLTLTLSDPMILPAVAQMPLRALGLHPVLAYNILLLGAIWLSGVTACVLIAELTGSEVAGFVSGLVFAGYSYRFDHFNHLELQMTMWMPLALLALHRWLRDGRRTSAAALAFFGVAQVYSSLYYSVFLALLLAVVGLGLVIVHRPPLRRLAGGVVIVALIAAPLAWPVAHAFSAAQAMKGDRSLDEVGYYSAEPLDYLRTHRFTGVWNGVLPPPLPERALFPGAVPLALAALAFVPPVTPAAAIYAAGLAVVFEASLGTNGVLFPQLRAWVPPVRGLRAPARLGVVVGLCLSILAGFGVARLQAWCPSPRAVTVMTVAVVGLAVVEAMPRLTLREVWLEPPDIYRALGRLPAVLAEMPMPQDEVGNVPYMYFSIWHQRPMVNGYSGFVPESYRTLRSDIRSFPGHDAIVQLKGRGVTHVTINCALPFPDCDETVDAMRRSPELALVAETRWQGRPVQLYAITP